MAWVAIGHQGKEITFQAARTMQEAVVVPAQLPQVALAAVAVRVALVVAVLGVAAAAAVVVAVLGVAAAAAVVVAVLGVAAAAAVVVAARVVPVAEQAEGHLAALVVVVAVQAQAEPRPLAATRWFST